MKRKLSVLLALALSVSMAVPAYAQDDVSAADMPEIEASAESEPEAAAVENTDIYGSEASEKEAAASSDLSAPAAEPGNDLITGFTVDFKGNLKDVILQVRYKDGSAWKDYPDGTFRLEEPTPSVTVSNYDMSTYGDTVAFVISDIAGTFSSSELAVTSLPAAAAIEIPVSEGLFDLSFTPETLAALGEGFVYTGAPITPAIFVTSGLTDPDPVDSQYYAADYTDNTNVGTAAVTVTPNSPFVKGCSASFSIKAFDLAAGQTTVKIDDVLYTGSAVKPDPVVKTVLNGKTVTLKKGTDYTVSYSNNKNIGTATATIKGKGNFTGSVSQNFQILDNTITSVTLKYSSLNYTGKPRTQTKSAVVKWGKKVLTYKTDYTVSYKNNVEVGTATMIVKGTGAYKGTINKQFKIVLPVKKLTITGIENKEYTGKAIKQDVVVKYGDKTLVNGTDYKVSYENNVEAGKASVIITGKGYYTGTTTRYFKITKPVSSLKIGGIKNQIYTGKAIELNIVVKDGTKKLVLNTDYTLTYTNNVGPGKAAVTIRGKGFYTGKVKKTFMIRKKVDELTITGIRDVTYNGKAQTFDIVVKDGSKVLVKGTDYRVGYENNKNAGTGTVIIKGTGNYTGSVSKSFKIKRAAVTELDLKYDSMEYNGSERTQTKYVVVKSGQMVLTKGTDFSVAYANNTEPGTATITVKGKGNFTGTISKNFTITKYKLKKKDVVLAYTTKPYSGKEYKPEVTVTVHYQGGKTEKLDKNKYKVTYKNNKNAGTASVIVEALGDHHMGSVTQKFKITPVEIGTVTLAQTEYTYDGTAQKPAVTVKATVDGKSVTLKEGTDYTLTYKNNVNAGTATASVTGKGNFKGTQSKNFTIKKARITVLTITGDSFTYTGSAITPSVTVNSGARTLVKGTEYTLSYTNNINVGTATVTVSGTGNYTGTLSKKFTINAKPITSAAVYLDMEMVMKNKNDQQYPTVTSVVVAGRKLTAGTDYTVVNPQIGNYDTPYQFVGYITINGKGNYTGSVKKKMTAMSDTYFIPKDASGKDIRTTSYKKGSEPLFEMFYNEGTKGYYYAGKDFKVTYTGNNVAGTATARVIGTSKALKGLDKTYTFHVYS